MVAAAAPSNSIGTPIPPPIERRALSGPSVPTYNRRPIAPRRSSDALSSSSSEQRAREEVAHHHPHSRRRGRGPGRRGLFGGRLRREDLQEPQELAFDPVSQGRGAGELAGELARIFKGFSSFVIRRGSSERDSSKQEGLGGRYYGLTENKGALLGGKCKGHRYMRGFSELFNADLCCSIDTTQIIVGEG